jgi:hypothetical protein
MPVRVPQLTLARLFLAQLFISPAFVAPLYYESPERRHPYVVLLACLIAPVAYVGLFVSRSAFALHRAGRRSSTVFASIRSGICFGAVFGALVLSTLAMLVLVNRFYSPPKYSFLVFLLNAVVLGAFIELHYVLIGAATGGLVGLAAELIPWPDAVKPSR